MNKYVAILLCIYLGAYFAFYGWVVYNWLKKRRGAWGIFSKRGGSRG